MFYRIFAVRTYFFYALLLMLMCIKSVNGQSSSFTYQGRLTDSGTAANGNYDLQLTLWDSLSGGTQIGSPITLSTVSVSNGVFTVSLDFGASSFPGANRFLELSARPSGGGSFTLLTPRQQISSTPYAVRSVSAANADSAATATNATQLGGVAASQYVQTNDSRLSNQRDPTAGSPNYIQNSTNQQSSTNFNISGSGTAGGTLSGNVVNATTQYNISGNRVLGSGGIQNLFAGQGASSLGQFNSLFGFTAGRDSNTNSEGNAFFGNSAGLLNTSGSFNTFLGGNAGFRNTTGEFNIAVGNGADFGSSALFNATAIGSDAEVDQDNSIVLGSIKGVNNSLFDTNVGIGTPTPQSKLHVAGNVRIDGNVTLSSLGAASSQQATLCRNTSSQIAFCNSSSLRYKTNVSTFLGGMEIVNRLRPISFTWKQDGVKDIGFGAEEVEKVAPLFAFRNDKGEIEGVRYDRLGVLFVNALKEQQAQIEEQRAELKREQEQITRQEQQARQERAAFAAQQRQLTELKKLVCSSHRRAIVCR